MRTSGLACLLACAFLATLLTAALTVGPFVVGSGASALAAPPGPDALPVSVLAVKSDDALDQAEALTQALRKAVRDSAGWALGEATQPLEFLMVKMNCPEPMDAACEARIADVIKADRYLWCVIKFEDKKQQSVVGSLNFWVRGKGTTSHELRYSANLTDPADDSLLQLATTAVETVTGGAPKGGLRVSTGGIAGQLFIDDNPMGALPAEGAEYQLPAGEHRIVVKAPGYADAETKVVVRPATTVDATLTLTEKAAEEPVDVRMIGGFVALGVGVAAGAVGLWAALDVNSTTNDELWKDFREQIGSARNACDVAANRENTDTGKQYSDEQYAEIADKCDGASTREIVQVVMFPLAAVAAGVGAYLLGTSSLATGDEGEEEVEAWTIQPVLMPDVQGLFVTRTF
jgi:hypothetical protein